MASTEESLVWTPELEVSLFHSMKGHKPVGINRHFHMACIHDKFSTSTGKKNISSKQIWDHLHELYNMQALDELESLPFPNEEAEFSLPDEIFETSRKVTNTSESPGASDAALLKMKLQGLANNPSNVSTPDSSPKRKRTRQVNSASSSQPSSPHPAPSSAKRRR
ncbi:MRG/MORF4L-binding protein [Exaiptasia diaphana]|uniref:MRG-binding protein n=1 Tax=Exaiptasia diaphana TaxID=2652724 RepID=A0A913WXQ2_EXADI|nr:MRG/MORF4L-binding protein [Exaiptasia diaphana]